MGFQAVVADFKEDIGTKCSWDIQILGQKVVETIFFWDKRQLGLLALGTKGILDIWCQGQIFGFTNIFGTYGIGTIYLQAGRLGKVIGTTLWGTLCPASKLALGTRDNHLWDKRFWENPQGTISQGLFTVHPVRLLNLNWFRALIT